MVTRRLKKRRNKAYEAEVKEAKEMAKNAQKKGQADENGTMEKEAKQKNHQPQQQDEQTQG